jgi:hypothetical protein
VIPLLLACTTPAPLTVVEVYDVPPPPGQRTVLVRGPHPVPTPLGAARTLVADGRPVVLDVVDRQAGPPTLTAYVAEADADRLLDARTLAFTD